MELTQLEKKKELIDLIAESFLPAHSSSHLSENNRKSLSGMISYLTRVKSDELINQKQFSELVTLTFANFIENEVEFRISKSVNQRLITLFENLNT